MSRITRNHLLIAPLALLALALASCFQDVGDCPTCPGANSASIELLLPMTGPVDSIYASVDGGAQVVVHRDRVHEFENLSAGTHELAVTRWLSAEGVVEARTSSLQILLEAGETRTVRFHDDFPLVTWGPPPGTGRAGGPPARDPIASPVG